MRRWILLSLLWIGGTAVATGVVFEAVVVMGKTFRDASEDSGSPRRRGRTTTTVTTAAASSGAGSTTAATSSTVGEPSTTATEPTTVAVQTTEPSPVSSGPPPTGSATSTGTRTSPPTTGTQPGTTPPTAASTTPATNAPPTQPTQPATTAPTTAPPTAPTTALDCPTQLKRVVGGSNSFSVKVCIADGSVRLLPTSIRTGVGYAPTIGSYGPPVVQVIFSGPTTYRCTVSLASDNTILGSTCDET